MCFPATRVKARQKDALSMRLSRRCIDDASPEPYLLTETETRIPETADREDQDVIVH